MSKETYSKDGAVCPYCGKMNSPHDDDLYRLYDEATDELRCISCDKDFDVEVWVSFSWRCNPREEENGDD